LLDITRIGSNKFQLRKRRVDIAAVIQQGAEAASPEIQRGGHECNIMLPPVPIYVEADPDRLAQIVTNLLNNAARYTPAGGRITLAVTTTDGEVVISVGDSGIGLRAEDLGRVFDMFTQLAEPGRGGLGIGLALVKTVVELHGGRVEAHSAGEGQGSRFDVHLPMQPAWADPLPTPPLPAPAPGPMPSRRVLVVDDNADAADMMKAVLDIHGHAVEVAYDGGSALRVLATFTPDIVLLDIGLPDIDGYELARVLRNDPKWRGAYLVAVTGWGQEEDRARARERGFDAHLTKPADLDEITRLIADADGVRRDSEPA
jgi:CheY-like chemotaxis protein